MVSCTKKKTLTSEETKVVQEFKELIYELRVVLIGPILQELLSEISNICRKNGIQGSHIDFLISSFAINNNIKVFTTDKDFNHYSKIIKEIKLHNIREDFKSGCTHE